jgi:hypothetical protein
MFALLALLTSLHVTVAQTPAPQPVASPSGAPNPTLAGWTVGPIPPTMKLAYAIYRRREFDRSESVLIASRQVCDCQPPALMADLQRAFTLASKGTAEETLTSTAICGQPALRLVITKMARPDNALKNDEVIAFRDGPALVTLHYIFRSDQPMPDAESAMTLLCPPVVGML